MKTIYKYHIEITDRQTILLPEHSQVIHAGLDPQGKPCLWAIVNTHLGTLCPLTVFVVGTGNPMPAAVSSIRHIGSFIDGPFVWHIFI